MIFAFCEFAVRVELNFMWNFHNFRSPRHVIPITVPCEYDLASSEGER